MVGNLGEVRFLVIIGKEVVARLALVRRRGRSAGPLRTLLSEKLLLVLSEDVVHRVSHLLLLLEVAAKLLFQCLKFALLATVLRSIAISLNGGLFFSFILLVYPGGSLL